MTNEKASIVPGYDKMKTFELTDPFVQPPAVNPGWHTRGWDLFDRGLSVLEIQKVDEHRTFTDDKEAAAYVAATAKATAPPEALAMLQLFASCLAPIIEAAQEATEGRPFAITLSSNQAEMIKRLRYW